MDPQTNTILRLFQVLFFSMAIPVAGMAQLSGSYTINPNSSASSTNYQDWASAIGDLQSGSRSDNGTAQGPGVNGAVTITVYDTIYTSTRIAISAITGTSASNTITFKSAGGDSSKCVLQYASSTSSTADFVLSLNGADYVTFQQIGFERTGNQTYSTVIEITSDADNNRFINCMMKGRKVPSSSSAGFTAGIGSLVYFTGNGDSTHFINNRMIYGYNGIYGATACAGTKIFNNIFDTSGSSGVYLTSQANLQIIGNTFNMGDFGPNQGHYVSYGMRIESSPSMLISKNKVYMMAKNGQVVRAIIIANTTSTSTLPARINNNFIWNDGGTGDCTGLAVYACNYVDFYYNNILITNSLANGSVYYHYSQYSNSNIRLVNNNLINKGTGFVYNVPGTNTGDITTVDYNNVFTNGTKLAKWGGTDYTSFSGWKSASTKDSNSINTDPGFVSNTDLHVSNISLNGSATPYSFVTDDIDGETRDTQNPDIGADEFFPVSNDAGIANLDSPLKFCPGTNVVKASFQNYGIDTIKSVTIKWQVNGVAQDSLAWTGNLAPGGSSASLTLGNFNFAANTAYVIKAWTEAPNNSADGKTQNDTVLVTRYAGVGGSYSIGDTSIADYKSFNDAITDMTARSICGPATFNVYDGTYTEQITLVELPGMGASNTVTFQSISGDSSKVVVTHASTTATGNNNATIQLRGADYVTFKGITIQRTGTNTYALVLHILDGAHNNTFTNCQMLGTAASSMDGVNIYSDQSTDTGNVFRNNYVNSGNYNMYYLGTSTGPEYGTVLEGNVFDSAQTAAVHLGYNNAVKVQGNLFRSIRFTNITNSFDLQLFDCDSAIRVTGNRFLNVRSEFSIHDSMCVATAAKPGIIANNFFARQTGTGIKVNGSSHHSIVYNSFYFSGNDQNSSAIRTVGSSGNIILLNNNIVMEEGYVFYITSTGHLSNSNYNNLRANGNRLIYYGNNFTSLTAYRNNSGYDARSVQLNPMYESATDLHMKNPQMKGLGTPYTFVTDDIDGDPRDATTPDIGADEFELVKDDAGIVALISPANAVCDGQYPVDIVLKNFGSGDLDSATIEWRLDGVAQTPYKWTGNLSTNQTDTVTLDTRAFSGGTSYTFIIKATMPNGNVDRINLNDSIVAFRAISATPNVFAGNDTTLCMGDSVLLGSAGAAGVQYVWFSANNNVIDTTDQLKVSPTVQSTYYLEATVTSTGCNNRDTVVVNVNSRPVANAGINKAMCPNNAVQIGSASQIGLSYSWTSIPPVFVSNSATPTVSPDSTTHYILKVTSTSTGCSDYDTATVTVYPLPATEISGKDTVCVGGLVNYQTPSHTNSSYTWQVSGGSIKSGQSTSSVNIEWGNAGTGQLIIFERSADNCNNADTIVVAIMNNPQAVMGISGTCTDAPIMFTDSSANVVSRVWSFGDGQTSTDRVAEHTYTNRGNYNVKLKVTNMYGCVDSVSQNQAVEDAPEPDFTTGAILCEGENITFTNTTTGNATGYKWDFDNGQISDQTNPVQVFSTAGTYNVTLIAEDAGCMDTIVKQVIINPKPVAAFTANVNGNSVSFVPADTTYTTYAWNFGDGQTSGNKQPTHTYTQNNRWFTVSLTVTSAEGCAEQSIDSVFIEPSSINELPNALLALNISPNPFREQSVVNIELAERIHLLVKFFDMSGKEIATLADGYQTAGIVQVKIDAAQYSLKAGVYMVLIRLNGQAVTRQVIKVE